MTSKIVRGFRGGRGDGLGDHGAKWQHLMWGEVLVPMHGAPGDEQPAPFRNDEERQRAWSLMRADMLAKSEPGTRPAAYFRYDLDILDRTVTDRLDMLSELLNHDLIEKPEAVLIDKGDPEHSHAAQLPYEVTAERLAEAVERCRSAHRDNCRFRCPPAPMSGQEREQHIDVITAAGKVHIEHGRDLDGLRGSDKLRMAIAQAETMARWHDFRKRPLVAAGYWHQADELLAELADIVDIGEAGRKLAAVA